jgi:hypothetical protein
MKYFSTTVLIFTLVTLSNSALASLVAPVGEVRGEYDPINGNIQISTNSVVNWYVEHVGFSSMTGDNPLGLPAGGGAVTDSILRIGETNFSASMTYDVNLGNVAIAGILNDGTLSVFWNTAPGLPTQRLAVDFVSAPSPVPIPAAIWLFGTALIGLIGFGKRKSKVAV